MFLNSIFLTHYKNYPFRQFYFTKKVVGIVGNNGVGKTNLLDAIYYLCFTKSYFSSSDSICINNNQQGFRIEGNFDLNNEAYNIAAILRETGKKEFSVNGEIYSRVSKHIGKFPCVVIAPDDVELIIGGSERRRKFLDALLSQLQPEYLQQLMDYNKLLQHRNSLLKQFADQQQDASLLSIIDEQLSALGQNIFNIRRSFLKDFLPKVVQHYKSIAQSGEQIELKYSSMLLDHSMSELLKMNLQKDKLLQRTNAGIHKDDIEFLMNGELLRQLGSQGQRKSLLFALKLSEFETLQQQKNMPPILLLDDVFEKLDASRMNSLLKEVCVEKQGQVFITDTHKDRLENNLSVIGADFEIIEL